MYRASDEHDKQAITRTLDQELGDNLYLRKVRSLLLFLPCAWITATNAVIAGKIMMNVRVLHFSSRAVKPRELLYLSEFVNV